MKSLLTSLLFILISTFVFSQEKNIFDIARKGTLLEIETIYKENPTIVNTVDERKSSPLILACYRSNAPVALFLADKVADLNYNSGMGSALMAAVMSGNVQIVEKLIAVKSDLNQFDSQGKTALIYAVFFNKNDIAKLLIQAGANKNQKDSDGKTALDFANFNKNTELIILLDQ
ncbi:ankyrin repeat domain-containing protein [Flavobacterium luteum]|uniref:Ankyrin repeat domain-containing protein n=1 Tax=Flavobacterium luteum TaxID=2026654 RepID=A0A7J5ABY5_9FLAO|nr:ankyrin repeat domain-containing protein [Flavobacterium luteum]KAB1155084.1 ankyrin repeat domain-containing protein [Flavobacterium luteum]